MVLVGDSRCTVRASLHGDYGVDPDRSCQWQQASLVEPDLPVQEPAYHADEARCVRGAALAALQALAEERLVQGVPDDVDGEHCRQEHGGDEDRTLTLTRTRTRTRTLTRTLTRNLTLSLPQS